MLVLVQQRVLTTEEMIDAVQTAIATKWQMFAEQEHPEIASVAEISVASQRSIELSLVDNIGSGPPGSRALGLSENNRRAARDGRLLRFSSKLESRQREETRQVETFEFYSQRNGFDHGGMGNFRSRSIACRRANGIVGVTGPR